MSSGSSLAFRDGRAGCARPGGSFEQHRWQNPDQVPRSERLLLTAERLEEELAAECRGNEAYEHARECRRETRGAHRVGGPPKPYEPPQVPDGKVNLSDPDSKLIKANVGYVQGYNAQAVVDPGQIVLAAEITNSTVDWSQLAPMVSAAITELENRASAAVSRPRSWTPSTGTSNTWTR